MTNSSSSTRRSIKGIPPFHGTRDINLTVYRLDDSFNSSSFPCTTSISPSSRLFFLCFDVFCSSFLFSECFCPNYAFQFFCFAAQGPFLSVFTLQHPVFTNFFSSQSDSVQISAGITHIYAEVFIFCFCTSTNATQLPDPQRPRPTQNPRSSRVTSASRKSTSPPSTILVRRPTIAPSKTPSGKASPKGQALCNRHRSSLVNRHLSLLPRRARYSSEKRTHPNPVALQLVRMNTSYFLTADSLPAAQYLVLPTHNTPRPRSFTLHSQTIKLPRHQRHPSSTTPNISRLLRYHPTSHITKQNRQQAPFASQRLRERHPSSTLTTSHLSQKRVTYPNDERVRNTATRRAIDKDKRHVPCCFRIHNGELISMTLQPYRLKSAMWRLCSQPCVRWGNDLSSMPTSYNTRHSLSNKLPQVISNSNAPCSGSKSSFAILVYFPDSVPFLTSVSFFLFRFYFDFSFKLFI